MTRTWVKEKCLERNREQKKIVKDFIFEDEGCPGFLHAPSAMSVGEAYIPMNLTNTTYQRSLQERQESLGKKRYF